MIQLLKYPHNLNRQYTYDATCQCSSAWLEHSPCKRKVAGSDPVIGFFIINIAWHFIQGILSDTSKPDKTTPKDEIISEDAPTPKDSISKDEDVTSEDTTTSQDEVIPKDTIPPKDEIISKGAAPPDGPPESIARSEYTDRDSKKPGTTPDEIHRHSHAGKPINKGMYAALVATVGVAAFFAGLSAPILNQDPIEMSDLNQAVLFLEDKIDRLSNDLRALEDRMLTEPTPADDSQPVVPSIDDDPVLGDIDAPITIIEFSDFQCPFCARFHAETLPELKSAYIETGTAKFVYRDFPIQNIHPNAVAAAVASECAHEQGVYWDYHDMLFENINVWGPLDSAGAIVTFQTYAADMGLDADAFTECLGSGEHITEVASDYADGVSYGITGTPAFFVGNDQVGYVMISGAQPFSAFQSVIERILDISTG